MPIRDQIIDFFAPFIENFFEKNVEIVELENFIF